MHELLFGIRAKIERADELIKNLNTEISAFFASDPPPYIVSHEFQKNFTQYVFLVREAKPVPLRFAVLAGEILHQLASSLDHLFCALVTINGKTVEKRHYFPVYTKAQEFRKACKKGAIEDVSPSAQDIIRSVQPYTASKPRDTILAVVRELNVIDKHRLPILLASAGRLGSQVTVGGSGKDTSGNVPSIVGFGEAAAVAIGKENKEFFRIRLGSPEPDFEAKTDIAPTIAFAQCGNTKMVSVVDELPKMLAGVVNTINLFHREFDAKTF